MIAPRFHRAPNAPGFHHLHYNNSCYFQSLPKQQNCMTGFDSDEKRNYFLKKSFRNCCCCCCLATGMIVLRLRGCLRSPNLPFDLKFLDHFLTDCLDGEKCCCCCAATLFKFKISEEISKFPFQLKFKNDALQRDLFRLKFFLYVFYLLKQD
jgi:hypothetical protein